jgi:hypothetical protein
VRSTAATADALNRAFFKIAMNAKDPPAARGAPAGSYLVDVVALGALRHRVRREIFDTLAHRPPINLTVHPAILIRREPAAMLAILNV